MALYTPIAGIITNIENMNDNRGQNSGCNVLFTLQSEEQGQGQFQVLLPADSYVLNLHPFQVGDRATFFYDPNAPMVLIYPPRYTAIAAANTPHGMTAMLDTFGANMVSSDNTLAVNPTWNTPITLPNGQTFNGNLRNHLLLVTYTASTRSIPAQTTPEQIVVFCTGMQ